MRSMNRTPVSIPKIPETHQHPLWQSWDLALENTLIQLVEMHKLKKEHEMANSALARPQTVRQQSSDLITNRQPAYSPQLLCFKHLFFHCPHFLF